MINAPVGGVTLAFGNTPRLCSGGDEHLASGSTHLAHRYPVIRSGATAPGGLETISRVEVSLLYFDGLPINVKLFRNQHGEHILDALPDFRIAGKERYRSIGVNTNEG